MFFYVLCAVKESYFVEAVEHRNWTILAFKVLFHFVPPQHYIHKIKKHDKGWFHPLSFIKIWMFIVEMFSHKYFLSWAAYNTYINLVRTIDNKSNFMDNY